MSEGEKKAERIPGPPATAAGQDKKLAQQEEKRFEPHRQKLTPAERHADSVDRHVLDICDDRERLRLQNSKLQAALDDLRPKYAALWESYRAALAVNVFSIVLVGVGGALISGAGYAPEYVKLAVLFLGIGTFIWGITLQIMAARLAILFRPKEIPTTETTPIT